MRMEGGYPPPPTPQMSIRHVEGYFGRWGPDPGPKEYREKP